LDSAACGKSDLCAGCFEIMMKNEIFSAAINRAVMSKTVPVRRYPTRVHVRVPGPASNEISAITMFHFY
jgi:hypothetical protein